MIMSSELTFSTPPSHLVKYIVPVVMVCLMSRQKVTVSDESLRIAFGFGKKDYPFQDTLFRYENPGAPINPLRRLGPRDHMFYMQRQGQKQAKMALNLATPDFEALIAALKERGAQIEMA